MRVFRVALVLLAVTACCKEAEPPAPPAPSGPVKWEISATVDKKEIQVAEPLTVSVTVRHPAGAEFFLAAGQSLLPLEVLERMDEPSDSTTETHVKLRVAAYRLPGEIALPPIKVEYRDPSDPSGKLAQLSTAPIPIKLVTSLTPDVTDIHDLKGPIEDLPVPSRWGRLWWLLVALAVAVAAYLLYRRLRRKRVDLALPAPAPPLPPPELEAEQALRALAQARLLEQGRVKEFYTQLAEIVKRYGGRRFEVAYLERTTAEILWELRKARVGGEWVDALAALLEPSDLVKFARVIPESEDSQRMLSQAFRFVDNTRRPPQQPPAPSPALEASA